MFIVNKTFFWTCELNLLREINIMNNIYGQGVDSILVCRSVWMQIKKSFFWQDFCIRVQADTVRVWLADNHFLQGPSDLGLQDLLWSLSEPCHKKSCLCHMQKTKVQISLHILISASVVFCLDSIIPLVSTSEISSLYLASVAAQSGLSLTWSEIRKTGFSRDEAPSVPILRTFTEALYAAVQLNICNDVSSCQKGPVTHVQD